MKKEDQAALIDSIPLPQRVIASALGVKAETVSRWRAGKIPMGRSVEILLNLLSDPATMGCVLHTARKVREPSGDES